MNVKKKTKLTQKEKLLHLKNKKIEWVYSNQKGEKRYVAHDCKDPQNIRMLGYFRTMGELLKHYFDRTWFTDEHGKRITKDRVESERNAGSTF